MIILAAAIILSLSNSGIIGKANKAKTDTDISNAKDLVAMAHADWMLDEAKIKENDNTITSFSNYAEKKLQEAGYKVGAGEGAYTVTEDGEVYSGLTETARAAIVAGIKIGDEVNYSTVLTEKSYTTDGSEQSSTGTADNTKKQTIKTNTSYTWKYIGLGEDGNLLITPDTPTGRVDAIYEMTLGDRGGYLNGPEMLNTACDVLYTVEEKGSARSMNMDDVTKLLEYNGPKGNYYEPQDADGNFKLVETNEPIMIKEYEAKFNTKLARNYVLEGKDLGEYKSDGYSIDKNRNATRITKDKVKQDLVFQEKSYWLASSSVGAGFGGNFAVFFVSYVDNSLNVAGCYMFGTRGAGSDTDRYVIRPVVSLITNLQKITENGKTIWTLS